MLKNILKLEGAQKLSKNEQKNIAGGAPVWCGHIQCDGVPVWYCKGMPNPCPQ